LSEKFVGSIDSARAGTVFSAQFVTDGSAPNAWLHVAKVWPPSCEVHTAGTSPTKSWYAT
jgi:hypothetical protein